MALVRKSGRFGYRYEWITKLAEAPASGLDAYAVYEIPSGAAFEAMNVRARCEGSTWTSSASARSLYGLK